jgi:hypothetical protein
VIGSLIVTIGLTTKRYPAGLARLVGLGGSSKRDAAAAQKAVHRDGVDAGGGGGGADVAAVLGK